MRFACLAAAVLSWASPAFAHGETSLLGSGGAIHTTGAAFSRGIWSSSLRFEMRHYDLFPDAQLLAFALDGEDVHQHAQEFSASLSTSYAIHEMWAFYASIPVNVFRDFREGSLRDDGTAELVVDDASGGIGDLTLGIQLRPWHDRTHHVGLLGAVELPTGMTYETDNAGERLGAHNQPGSGSLDVSFGAAYSAAVDWFALDADVIGSLRTEGATDFQAGGSLQVDLALSATVWQLTFVVEANLALHDHDVEHGTALPNSGGHVLHLSPAIVARPAREHMLFVSFSFPVIQDLFGIQNTEAFRANVGYSLSIDTEPPAHHHDHRHGPNRPEVHDHPHVHGGEHLHPHRR